MPSATAILDRFLHHAVTITITGRSYRLRQQPPAPGETLAPTTDREGPEEKPTKEAKPVRRTGKEPRAATPAACES